MRAVALALLLAPSVAVAQVAVVRGGSLGGTAVGNIDLDGTYDLILDADGNSKIETGVDDRYILYLSSNEFLRMSPSFVRYTPVGGTFTFSLAANDSVGFTNDGAGNLGLTGSTIDIDNASTTPPRLTFSNGATTLLSLGVDSAIAYAYTPGSFYLQLDSDNDSTTSSFIICSNSASVGGGACNTVIYEAGRIETLALAMADSTVAPIGGATAFAVTRSYHKIDCDAGGNTIGTITGGNDGQILVLDFVDASCTITDTGTSASNTINLSAAFTSTTNDTLTLIYDGTSWREIARAVN